MISETGKWHLDRVYETFDDFFPEKKKKDTFFKTCGRNNHKMNHIIKIDSILRNEKCLHYFHKKKIIDAKRVYKSGYMIRLYWKSSFLN